MNKVILTAFIIITTATAYGQRFDRPKSIKSKGDFVHPHADITFPMVIDKYVRTDITAFDRQRTDVSAEYKYATNAGETKICIYFPGREWYQGTVKKPVFIQPEGSCDSRRPNPITC